MSIVTINLNRFLQSKPLRLRIEKEINTDTYYSFDAQYYMAVLFPESYASRASFILDGILATGELTIESKAQEVVLEEFHNNAFQKHGFNEQEATVAKYIGQLMVCTTLQYLINVNEITQSYRFRLYAVPSGSIVEDTTTFTNETLNKFIDMFEEDYMEYLEDEDIDNPTLQDKNKYMRLVVQGQKLIAYYVKAFGLIVTKNEGRFASLENSVERVMRACQT